MSAWDGMAYIVGLLLFVVALVLTILAFTSDNREGQGGQQDPEVSTHGDSSHYDRR